MPGTFNRQAYAKFKNDFDFSEKLSTRVEGPIKADLQNVCAALSRVTGRLALDWDGVWEGTNDPELQQHRAKSPTSFLPPKRAKAVRLQQNLESYDEENEQNGDMERRGVAKTTRRLSIAEPARDMSIALIHNERAENTILVPHNGEEKCFLCASFTRDFFIVPDGREERKSFLDSLVLISDKQRAAVQALYRNQDIAYCCFFHTPEPLPDPAWIPFDNKENQFESSDAENEDCSWPSLRPSLKAITGNAGGNKHMQHSPAAEDDEYVPRPKLNVRSPDGGKAYRRACFVCDRIARRPRFSPTHPTAANAFFETLPLSSFKRRQAWEYFICESKMAAVCAEHVEEMEGEEEEGEKKRHRKKRTFSKMNGNEPIDD